MNYYFSIFLRLAMAMAMGAAIGYERAAKKSTAGLRTFSLVWSAAAFTMIINEYLIDRYGTGDPARLAAQVISGIGFLGMGSIILTSRNQVRGLTTAGTLWATAILGIALGAGMLIPSLIAFSIMLFTTTILYYISQHLERYNRYITIYLEVDKNAGLRQIIETLTGQGYEVMQLQKHKSSPEGDLTLQLDLNLKGKYLHSDVVSHLGEMESIHYIEEVKKK